jgi:serine protease
MRLARFIPCVILALIAIPSSAGTNPAPSTHRIELLFAQPNATAAAPLKLRIPFPKPSHHELVTRQHDDSASIKFAEGSAIRLRGTNLIVLDSELELDRAARQGVTRENLYVQLAILNEILRRGGASIERPLTTPEDTLHDQRHTGEQRSLLELPDLNLFFDLRFPGKAASDVINVLDALNQLELIEYAAPTVKVAPPPAADIPPTTPDFTGNQTYFASAPGGIDVQSARLLPGGRGEGVRVVDVEDGWSTTMKTFRS